MFAAYRPELAERKIVGRDGRRDGWLDFMASRDKVDGKTAQIKTAQIKTAQIKPAQMKAVEIWDVDQSDADALVA